MFRQRTAPRSRPLLQRTCKRLFRMGRQKHVISMNGSEVSVEKSPVARFWILFKVGVDRFERYPGTFQEHWMAASLLRGHGFR